MQTSVDISSVAALVKFPYVNFLNNNVNPNKFYFVKMYMSEDSYSRYMENLNFYYSIINNHGITDDGKYLLASIKSGYLAVFPIYKFLNEIYLMNELSNSDNNETSPNIKPERLKPISLVKLQNSHSLCLDKRNKNSSDYRFVTGGKGMHQFSIEN